MLRPKTAAATGRPTEELYGRAGPLVRCEGCGLVRQDPPARVPYGDAEDPDYLNELEGLRVTFRRTLATIERFRLPPGRFLDVGAGPGVLVEEAAERGWDAFGVELSAWAVNEAQRRGVDVRMRTLGGPRRPAGSVDAAALADVIEHVPDPLGTMRRLHELLKPGGVVFLATPNVDSVVARTLRRWWWSVLPGHIWLFSKRDAHAAGARCGVRRRGRRHPPEDVLGRLLRRTAGRLQRRPRTWRARASRREAAGDRLVTPDFRDRVALVARKPG